MPNAEKKGVLRFEEGIKPFICWTKEKGLTYPQEIAVDIYLDKEDIGYITKDGKITIRGHVIERDPSTIMSYSNTFTSGQWAEIGTRAKEFMEKYAERSPVEGKSALAGYHEESAHYHQS